VVHAVDLELALADQAAEKGACPHGHGVTRPGPGHRRLGPGLARLREKGRRISRWAPYGFKLGAGAPLLPEPREQAYLRRIAALRASGVALRAISDALAADGIMARNGPHPEPMTARP
jgi:hypothetical protein